MAGKKIFLNFALLFGAILIGLLLTELVIRVFFPQNLDYTMFDEDLMYRHVPNHEFDYARQEFRQHVVFNSKGLRDYEYPYDKGNNSYRILVLGDSFPEALQVPLEESFTKLLEKKLNELSKNGKFEVVNAGTGGYGTENELIFLKNEAIKYNPDAIVLAFFLNDIEENAASPLIRVEKGKIYYDIPINASVPKKIMLGCSRKLQFCALLQSVVLTMKKESNIVGKRKFSDYAYLKKDNPEFKKAFDDTLVLIYEMSQVSKKHSIGFTLVAIPSKEQVDKSKMQDYLEKIKVSSSETDPDKIQRILEDFSRKNDIEFVDLLPSFKEKNSNNDFYFNIDGHWNQKGHELAADIMYNELYKKQLERLPKRGPLFNSLLD